VHVQDEMLPELFTLPVRVSGANMTVRVRSLYLCEEIKIHLE
jgi:hypothetical protein